MFKILQKLINYLFQEHLIIFILNMLISLFPGMIVAFLNHLPYLRTIWQIWQTSMIMYLVCYLFIFIKDRFDQIVSWFPRGDISEDEENPLFWSLILSLSLIFISFWIDESIALFWIWLFRWAVPMIMLAVLSLKLINMYRRNLHTSRHQ